MRKMKTADDADDDDDDANNDDDADKRKIKLYFSLSLVSRFALVSRSARNIAFAPLGS